MPGPRLRLVLLAVVAGAAVAGMALRDTGPDNEVAAGSTTTTAVPSTTTGSSTSGLSTTTTVAPTTTVPFVPVPTGEFIGAAGSSAPVGEGPLRQYRVEVESGAGVDPAEFAVAVDAILADPRGWTADGSVSLQRVEAGGDFRVVLATPETTDQLCLPLRTNGIFSCFQDGRSVINLRRWMEGKADWGLGLEDYRSYVISHEVGHALGHDHAGCPSAGALAPVMMQQTKGLAGCLPNPWPFP